MGVLKVKVGSTWIPIGYYQQPVDSALYVQKIGDTMTGNLTVQPAASPGLTIGNHPAFAGSYGAIWRPGAAAAGDYAMLVGTTATYINTPSGGSIYLRANNTDIATFSAAGVNVGPPLNANGVLNCASTVNMAGNSVLYWPAWGGGWNMTDATWIRSYNNKNVYCSALLGCYNLSVGLGGAITGGYYSDLNGNMYVRQAIRTDGWLQAVRGASVVWNQCHVQAYSTADYVCMSFYQAASGIAPLWRNHSSDGWTLSALNSDQSGWANVKGYSFVQASSMTLKHDIRSLSPDMEPRPSDVPWDVDVITVPDIMALRPVCYRRNDFPQKLIRIDDGADTLPMDQQEWEIIENDNPVMQVDYKREQLGLIAEEVARVLPSAVQFDCNTGAPAGINYTPIVVAMLDHIQRLTRHVETLQYRVAELERQ